MIRVIFWPQDVFYNNFSQYCLGLHSFYFYYLTFPNRKLNEPISTAMIPLYQTNYRKTIFIKLIFNHPYKIMYQAIDSGRECKHSSMYLYSEMADSRFKSPLYQAYSLTDWSCHDHSRRQLSQLSHHVIGENFPGCVQIFPWCFPWCRLALCLYASVHKSNSGDRSGWLSRWLRWNQNHLC